MFFVASNLNRTVIVAMCVWTWFWKTAPMPKFLALLSAYRAKEFVCIASSCVTRSLNRTHPLSVSMALVYR